MFPWDPFSSIVFIPYSAFAERIIIRTLIFHIVTFNKWTFTLKKSNLNTNKALFMKTYNTLSH